MCGIVGAIVKGSGGFSVKAENSFLELLYVDAVRGYDSTGVITVKKDGGYGIMKEAEEAALFIPAFKATKLFSDMFSQGKTMIGHNRKKTIGNITDEAAHPFVVDDTFAMVHNGTLHGHKLLAEKDTDSEALAHVIKEAFDKDNWKESLEEVLGKVFGAYALVMFDQKKEHVMFLRNKERPLWMVEVGDTLFFASEPMMASWILCRNGYEYKDIKVSLVEEHELGIYDLVKNTLVWEKLVPKKPILSPTTTPTVTGMHGGQKSGAAGMGGRKLSKQAVKFFRKKYLKERIAFWADDYVERDFPKTIDEDGVTEIYLFAKAEEIAYDHNIAVEVDIKEWGFSSAEEIFEQKYSAIIDDIEYNDETGSVLLYVSRVKPIVQSIRSKPHSVRNRTELEEKLADKSLTYLEAELQVMNGKLCRWEQDVYEEAITSRKRQVASLERQSRKLGYDACHEEAEQEGVKLREERDYKLGKLRLIHPDKGLIYEAPITVH
jgi:hypothetical protein